MSAQTIHASAIRLGGTGILLQGVSGSGKSRLAVALLEAAGCAPQLLADPGSALSAPEPEAPTARTALIGDDRLFLQAAAGKVLARPAPALAGYAELRGLGLVAIPWLGEAAIELVVSLVATEAAERLPDGNRARIEGVDLPCLEVPIGDLAHQMLLVRTARHLLVGAG